MSFTKNPLVFSYDELEKYLDDTVIELVSLFGNKEISDIKEAKEIIVNTLLIDPKSYIDYHDDSFIIISLLFSKVKADDREEFTMILMSSTCLLESLFKVDDLDSQLCERIGIIVSNLYDKFIDEIKNHPDLD